MIIAIVVMFVAACITLLTIVDMVCDCIIESKKNSYDEGNVYTVSFEEEEKEEEKKDKR